MSSLFKAIKKGRVNHWTWKLALLLVLTLYLFFKIKGNDQRWSDIEIKEPILLLFVACCGFIQWLVEWKKWEIVCSTAKVGVGNIEREKAFYGGIISGFILPGGIFNFIGRMLPFTTIENRILLPLTWYSNASQFLPSVFFGLIALFLFGFKIQLSDLLIPIFEWKTLIVSMSFFALAVFLFTPFEKIKWFYYEHTKRFT